MKREQIILGGFKTWVEYNPLLCCITLFGFETAVHGLCFDVMGSEDHKHVNGFISIDVSLTEQEKKELNNYINNLVVSTN